MKEHDGLGRYDENSPLDGVWAYVAIALLIVTGVCAYMSGALGLALDYFQQE